MRRDSDRASRPIAVARENRDIGRVAGGFAAVTLGEWVLGTTLAVYAFREGGALAVGFVGSRFAPAAVAGLWMTRFADPGRHRRVLSVTALTRAAMALAAVGALALGLPFALVISLVWLDAAAGSAYRPAQAALLPTLARSPGELTAGAALLSNVKTSGQMIGALLGGALVAGVPIALAVAVAVGLYGSAALLTLDQPRQRQLAIPRVGLGGLRAGLEALRHSRRSWLVVLNSCLRSLVRGLWLALAVVVSLRLLSLGRSGFGILMAAAAGGALLALGVMPRLVGSRRMAGWLALGLVLCGLPVAAVAPLRSAAPAVALMVVWGFGMALSDAGAQTLLNRLIPGAQIGPVTGVMESGKLLLEGAGSLLAPALLVAFGTRSAVLVTGLALPVIVVLASRGLAQLDATATARVDVLGLLQRVAFFAPLRVDALEGVAARLRTELHPAGTEIVRQDDHDAHSWYLVEAGELAVEVDGFVIGRLTRGSQFGERGLLRRAPRSATVRAVTDVRLYALERDDFLGAVAGVELAVGPAVAEPHHERLEPSVALSRLPLLDGLDPAVVAELLEHSAIAEIEPATPIVVAGEADDRYYVLLSGRAEVMIDGKARRELLPGDAFGEIGVLHRVPRTATVVAGDGATVLSLNGEALRAAVRGHGGDALGTLAG